MRRLAIISQYFTGRILPFCSPDGNDKVVETHEHKGEFKEW
jgi:hypothetical protein